MRVFNNWLPWTGGETLPDTAKGRLKKERAKALEQIRHVTGLRESQHWEWFQEQLNRRVKEMEARLCNPKLVKDEDMPAFRLQLEESRHMAQLLDLIEEEMQRTIDQIQENEEVEIVPDD
jgi:hypothetical protein